jgi:hypothetical protein
MRDEQELDVPQWVSEGGETWQEHDGAEVMSALTTLGGCFSTPEHRRPKRAELIFRAKIANESQEMLVERVSAYPIP